VSEKEAEVKSKKQKVKSDGRTSCLLPFAFCSKNPSNDAVPPTFKYRLKLSKTGILRYFSHLDWQNTFMKALARSGLNIGFSHGFNPSMKVSLGVALPLFLESAEELIDIELLDNISEVDVKLKLEKVLPDGCEIISIVKIDKSAKSIDLTAQWAEYKVGLFENGIQKFDSLIYNMNKVLSSEEIIVTKKNKKGLIKKINVKSSVKSYRFEDENLFIILKTGQREQTAKRLAGLQDVADSFNESVKGEEIPSLRADDLMKVVAPEVLFDIRRLRFFDDEMNEI